MLKRELQRREILKAGAALGGGMLFSGSAIHASTPADGPRVAALGWACAQTLLAIGAVPCAVPELDRYRRLVVEPALPASVTEAGLRSEPNLELLKALSPDLIVVDISLMAAVPRLKLIAPVEVFMPPVAGRRPLETARQAMIGLSRRIGREAECDAFLARFDTSMAKYQEMLRSYDGGPLYISSEIVRNRALVFGPNSLYQDVLDRFGLKNAFTGATSIWGHATVGLETLATVPEARFVLLNSRLADLQAMFAARPIMRSLPFLREGRLTVLAEVLFYGGVPSAERFARLLAERLPVAQ